MRYLCFLLIIFISYISQAQSFDKTFGKYVEEVRPKAIKGEIPSLPYELLRGEKNLDRVLPAIDRSLIDTLVIIRRLGYQSLDVLHRVFDEKIEKQRILGIQFKGLEDSSFEIQSITLDNMNDLDPDLFTNPQKQRLIQLLNQEVSNKEVLIELVGKMGEQSAIESLRSYSRSGNPPKIRWATYLAMARLGDQSAITTVKNKVSNLQVDSDVVYNIVPGLIYTNQKELYDYLVEELNKEEKNCEPADPDQTRAINCAYRILEYLTPHIVDFPLTIGASGDIETNNYRKALETAREWFAVNPNYQIL